MLENLDYDKLQDVDWMMGAAVMLKRDLVEKIGLFDEDYKLFVEDTDLCFRIRKAGKRVVFLPDAVVFHYHGASVKEGFSKAQVYHNIGMFNFSKKFYKNSNYEISPLLWNNCKVIFCFSFLSFRKSFFVYLQEGNLN